MSPDYNVKLQIFEGPLDLLLHLIKMNEMDVTEIAIAEITAQYLEYLRLMETLDLEVAGDYLVMAASLINIKLRSLLPAAPEEEESEEDDVDHFLSARALMQQLIEYRKFKEAALDLSRRFERQTSMFMREVALPSLAAAETQPAVRGDMEQLLAAFARVLRFVERRGYHEVQGEEFTVEDKIGLLRRRMLIDDRLSVDALFEACESKIEMIVLLIAMLELCRLKELRLAQQDAFGEIFLTRAPATRGEGGADNPEARALASLEAEIIAGRTGLVDDGVIPEFQDEPTDESLGEPLDDLVEEPSAEPKPPTTSHQADRDGAS